jgi:hypothetical protein
MNILLWLTALFLCASSVVSAQTHLNYTAQMNIDGNNSYTYTVQYEQKGDTTQRITSYYFGGKQLVRQEITHFRAKPLTLFSNKVEDFRTGEWLWQTAFGTNFTTKRRERKGAEIEEKTITAERAIVTTLVSEGIANNAELLERGQPVRFTVAVASRGVVTEMTVEKTGNEVINGVQCTIVTLNPSNIIFKLLMGEPSYFTFESAAPHRFMRFKGSVGLPDKEGQAQRGLVTMKY